VMMEAVGKWVAMISGAKVVLSPSTQPEPERNK
jgi:hypothetical protein